MLLAGCASDSPGEDELKALGQPDCKPFSPVVEVSSWGTEIIGTPSSQEGATFGFMQTREPEEFVASGEDRKFVVRVSGKGDLAVTLTGPTGNEQELLWGPEFHNSSNIDRPGDEWGMGFQLNQPGCWNLSLHRGGTEEANFWFKMS